MSTTSARPIQPEDLLALKTIAEAQISPDGTRVAYVLTEIDAEEDEYRSTIWIVPAEGGEPVQFTRGPKRDTAPRWSPDGRRLAFLSTREGDKPQLYVMPVDGGEPRKITALDEGAGPAEWSPDGSTLLFAAKVLTEQPPADEKARKRWEQRPKVVTKAHYKDDGSGYTFDGRTHLFVVPAEGGEPRQITDGDTNDRMPAWSRDGTMIAFVRDRFGTADYNLTDVWVVGVDGGNPRQISHGIGRAVWPAWSPDGTTIACYGTDTQEHGLGDPELRVWTVSTEGGAPAAERRLTAGYDRSVYAVPTDGSAPAPIWAADGATITFTASDAGNVHLVRVAVADGSVRPVAAGERQITAFSAVPAAGRIAFVGGMPDNPADVYVCTWDGADERRLTRVNEAALAGLVLPRVERRTFDGPNGAFEGWLVRPVTGSGPAPLLVHIHGGPHGYVGNTFPHSSFYWYVLAARGWAVIALNPSGSGSYGRAFAHSLRGRWGEYDLPEQHAAVDALVAEGLADPDRLAVTGYSYGGYMTSWTVGHTDRFKAAVVGAPVTNLESMYGTSDIAMWFEPWEMNGDLFENRETYRRLSPITYVDRVTTPTLILHGEADDRCPIGQGEEFYIGLVAAGKAPAEFVRYPGGSHLFPRQGRPSHRVDFNRRTVEWVERYTTARAESAPRMAAAPGA